MFALALFEDGKYTVGSQKVLKLRDYRRSASAPYNGSFFKCSTFTLHDDRQLLDSLARNISSGVPVVSIDTLQGNCNTESEVWGVSADALRQEGNYNVASSTCEIAESETWDLSFDTEQLEQNCNTASSICEIAESEIWDVCFFCGILSQNIEYHITECHKGADGNANLECDDESSKSSTLSCVSETLSNIEIKTPAAYGILDIQSVASSRKGTKRYFCKFCCKMVTKIARHLESVHKDEKEVKSFSLLPKGCPERKKIIHLLRSAGSFVYNTNSAYNKGDLIVSRRPRANLNRTPDSFECCPKCKASFSKLTLRHHAAKCLKNSDRYERSIMVMGKRIRGALHPAASDVVKEKIFPYLREDHVVACIRYDELVIRFCNQLCLKYRSSHHHKMIRSQIRLLGRFLLHLKELDSAVSGMSDTFEPKRFDLVIQVIGRLGDYDEQSNIMRKPNVPLHIGTLLKKLAKFYISECIKKADEISQKKGNDFLSLIATDFNAEITQTALESRLDMQRKKKIELPSDADVQKLLSYILRNVKYYYEDLSNKYTFSSWKELASFSLLWVVCFNRRRVGEVERMKIVDFNLHHGIDKVADEDIYRSLSTEGKKAACNFRRVSLRGKLGRTVHVLLCKLVFRSLEAILKYRGSAGVNAVNPFVFGIPGGEHKFIEACFLLREHSKKCGASRPDLLRGTHLRKHIATRSVLLNLTNTEISDLANYMGHTEQIHKSHYRLPIITREITEISKLLQKAQGFSDFDISKGVEWEQGSSSNEDDELMSEVSHESPENEPLQDFSYISHLNNSREEIAKYLPSDKKTPWKTLEIVAVREMFKEYILEKKVPSMNQCCQLRLENDNLRNRSPQAIRTFIAGEIKRNSPSNVDFVTPKNSVSRRKRWSSTEEKTLKENFKIYYDTGKLPSLRACKQLIEENTVLIDRTPEVVKAKVNNDLTKQARQ